VTRYKLTREEMETVIRGNAADKEWEIITADQRIIRKLGKQGYRPCSNPNPWGYVSFSVPFAKIRIGKAVSLKRGKFFSAHANLHVKTDQNQTAMVS
jgi:hypothetical protein